MFCWVKYPTKYNIGMVVSQTKHCAMDRDTQCRKPFHPQYKPSPDEARLLDGVGEIQAEACLLSSLENGGVRTVSYYRL